MREARRRSKLQGKPETMKRLIVSSRGRMAAAAVIGLIVALCRVSPAQADQATALARRHNVEAEKQFSLGHFREAAAAYEKAYQARPVPEFLHNLGQCYKRMPARENLDRALFFFESYLNNAPNTPSRKDVEAEIAGLKRQIEVLRRSRVRGGHLAPTPAVSGRRAVQPAPFYRRWWFWTVVGAVAVGAAATAAAVATRPQADRGVMGTLNPGQIQF
jgi:hypothetical protein